jgi:serine phosphatase RsbU (regulator of sigma subunit)
MYIGDVAGKGLRAALYAALAVGTLRGIHKTGQHTAIQDAIFNPETEEMSIASAVMPGPLLRRGVDTQVLQVAGIPPGLFPDVTYDVLKVKQVPGNSVLFSTDGMMDTRNIHEQDFEVQRLKDNCYKHAGESRRELLAHIFSAIEESSTNCLQWDHRTAAVFHYSGSS